MKIFWMIPWKPIPAVGFRHNYLPGLHNIFGISVLLELLTFLKLFPDVRLYC